MDLTARCNNSCRHCYINLPVDDPTARKRELTFGQVKQIIDQSVSLGALWVLISGGEPLLRNDFIDIYLYMKKKGLLVSLFTNASLITPNHVKLFKRYPPRDIEITVYGVSSGTHRQVTQSSTFDDTMNGIDLLLSEKIPITLKSTIIQSNVDEFDEISAFCRQKTLQPFRFDPFLQLRLDRNSTRNKEIKKERLTPQQVAAIEHNDPDRYFALAKKCSRLNRSDIPDEIPGLFTCQAGINSCSIGYDGTFRLCSSLNHSATILDLKAHPLKYAWEVFTPNLLEPTPPETGWPECMTCNIRELCTWCPAHADLETGCMTEKVSCFCDYAQSRRIN